MKKFEDRLVKVYDLAKKFGYVEIDNHNDYVKPEDNAIPIATFVDEKDKNNNTWVHIYFDVDLDQACVSYYYWSGSSGIDGLHTWSKKSTWEQMLNSDE